MKKSSTLMAFLFVLLSTTVNAQNQNVGIGTTTPSQKLDVNGASNLNGTVYVQGTIQAASSSNLAFATSDGTPRIRSALGCARHGDDARQRRPHRAYTNERRRGRRY